MLRKVRLRLRLSLICGLAVVLTVLPARAQEVTATITGSVTDQSGAPIVGAAVTAVDVNRGTSLSTQTNGTGVFNIPHVPVGTYEVKIESKGFQTAIQKGITLDLNQTARLNFPMKVGNVSETIEVSSEAPILQTDNTTVNTIIDSKTNDNLPLATRNYVQLTLLAPGSVTPNPGSFNSGDNTQSGGRPYINGNREQANNFLLDGMDNNQVSDNLLGYTPVPDAIQEFDLITNNASAEFGNFEGGIVSTSIKSGTNALHGDVWEYFRNDVLNANSWENKLNPATAIPKPALRWNMFGGTIGGPIIKNKLFFFADYQGQRFDHPSTVGYVSGGALSSGPITVFTAAERNGDFGAICQSGFTAGICNDRDSKGNIINQVKNPYTGVPFANNVVTLPINSVAAALFASSLYPTPINGDSTRNAINTASQRYNTDQGDIKIDANLTNKDHLFGRFCSSVPERSWNELRWRFLATASRKRQFGVMSSIGTTSFRTTSSTTSASVQTT